VLLAKPQKAAPALPDSKITGVQHLISAVAQSRISEVTADSEK